jgi:predicted dehydrogenase
MSSDTPGIAVIGAGVIGQDHIALIQASPFCHLAGISDITAEAADIAAKTKTTLYRELEMLIQREAPDGIIIATPNGVHAENAQLCAEHKIPMLIEKPIAGTLQDAHKIEQLVEERDAIILVGHYRRFSPLVAKCRALLREGAIGKPIGCSVIWSLRKPNDYFDVAWRTQRQNGGVALINLIHDIDNLRFMLGEIETVFAQSSNSTRELEVDDTYSISLKFENGVLGTILVSDVAPSPWAYEATTTILSAPRGR